MRIGVDAACWANGRGYGRFTREIVPRMVALAPEHEWLLFADERAAERLDIEGNNVRIERVEQSASPTDAASAAGYRSPADMLRLTRAVWAERPDVFFSPTVYTYFPLPPRQRAVVGIHDAIAERFPEWTMASPRARLFWRAKVRLALMQARLVMTVSEFSARELSSVLGVGRTRIRVVAEAPAEAYQPTEDRAQIEEAVASFGLGPDDRWFVYVGGFNPHKRVDLLVRAHAEVVRAAPDRAPHLLLVGDPGADVFLQSVSAIKSAIEACGTESLVHWTGFVPDERLRHLHSGAIALVLPSLAEGFGLPAVEAAACGAPVVATTASPLPELLEGAGLFVPPGDADALATAMRRLAEDAELHARCAETAFIRARALTWDAGARAALDTLYEAAA